MLRGALSVAAAAGLALAACNASTSDDPYYPACNGDSNEGLTTESSSTGQCPAHPVILVGTAAVGAACGSAADCAPTCCACPGGASALTAQCLNGSCLDGEDTCCLYAQYDCSN